MTAFNDTFGIIGLSSENVGIDRRIYTGLTSTNPQLNVSYNGGRVDVYLNGVKLMGNHSGQSNYDYTYQSTGSGSAITLSTGVALVATDTIECVGYVSNSSNTVTTYTPSVSAGNNTFTSISHTSSDLLNVFLNGVLLDPSDYTADASADTVAITSLASGDVVHIQVIGALDHSNFVPESGGTFSGDVAVNGDFTVDTDTLKVDSANNRVGIGLTTSPSQALHVDGNIRASGDFYGDTDTSIGNNQGESTEYSQTDNAVKINTVGTERLRIDSSGNVGIGTSTIGDRLVVSRLGGDPSNIPTLNANVTAVLHSGNGATGSGSGISLLGGTASDGMITFDRTDTSQAGRIIYRHPSDSMAFETNTTEGLRIDSSGNVELKTSNAYLKLPSGGGINFSNYGSEDSSSATTVSSNLLDDYEEGTHSPTITGFVSGTVSTSDTMRYTKIGRLVNVIGSFSVTGVSNSPEGSIVVTLPFSVSQSITLSTFITGTSLNTSQFVAIAIANSEIRIYRGDNTTISSFHSTAQLLGSGDTIYLNCTYYT